MSAYQFPAAAPSYPQTAAADPTAVMGRRIVAWVIDFLLYALVMAFVSPTPLSPLAEYVDQNDNPGVTCEQVEDVNDVSGCVDIGDRLYFTDDSDAAIQFGAVIAFVLLYSALQGATGVTPGKAALGVKVVDEQGQRPGFGKSILRTILWAVDLAPWCIPGLVGFITGLTSKGHRRVGDMAAKTFVVGKAHTGPVQVPGIATAAAGGYPAPGAPGGYGAPEQPWGAPPPGATGGPPTAWGGPPQGQQPAGWGAQPSGGFPPAGAPGPAAGGPPIAGTPAPGSPATGTAGRPSGEQRPAPPTTWSAPGGEAPTTPTPAPTPSATPPEPPAATPSSPTSGDDTVAAPAPADRPSRPEASPPSGTDAGSPSGAPAPGAPAAGTPPTTTAAPGTPAAGSPEAGAPGQPAGATPGAAATAGPASQAAPSGYNPQWDAARGTYIVWEPNRGKWLGWDEAAREWKPL